jgi:tetratricopeptide (TPR) repeat protein
MSTPAYRRRIPAASIALQLVTVIALFALWQTGYRWAVAPALVVLGFLLFALPIIVAKHEARFQHRALVLLSSGRAEELIRFARRQFLLSTFGASAPVDARLGLAYTQLGQYAPAKESLAAAIPFAPPAELPTLQAALVRALFVIGDPDGAEREGLRMLDGGGPRLPEVMVMIARARLGLKKKGQLSFELLDEADRMSVKGDVELMRTLTRIEHDIAYGHRPADVPDGADSAQAWLRSWTHFVRGRLRESRGHADDALQSYAKAARESGAERCWFAQLARAHIEDIARVTPDLQKHLPADDSVDDALRRKKKKRR